MTANCRKYTRDFRSRRLFEITEYTPPQRLKIERRSKNKMPTFGSLARQRFEFGRRGLTFAVVNALTPRVTKHTMLFSRIYSRFKKPLIWLPNISRVRIANAETRVFEAEKRTILEQTETRRCLIVSKINF